MDAGLLERRIPRRSRGRLGMDRRRLLAARAARRLVEQPSEERALRQPGHLPRRCRLLPHRLSRGPRPVAMLGALLKSLFARKNGTLAERIEEAGAHAQRGELDRADALLRVLAQEHPREAAIVGAQGLVAYQRGRFPEAARLLERARAQAPEDPVLMANYAEALRSTGELNAAEPLLRRALGLQPGNVDAWLNYSLLLMQRGQREEAVQAAQGALTARPDHARAHMVLGCALLLSTEP